MKRNHVLLALLVASLAVNVVQFVRETRLRGEACRRENALNEAHLFIEYARDVTGLR